ncbi:MAG: ABC transporter ATP-binding protein [Planctomycetota bacterium]
MTAPLLQARGLAVHRGGVQILDAVDWTVTPGEHWAVIGPNGCGKTALLNCILTYMDMGAGDLTLFGQRYGASDWQRVRQRVGLVSMGIARQLHDHDSAGDIVCAGSQGHLTCFTPPGPGLRRRARAQLAACGGTDMAERAWGVLSQGERARVLIARALMPGPRLLFLDEPCTGLDPVAREHYLADLQRLMAGPQQPGVILVTHHLEELPPGITHALLLRAGRVVAAGACRQVLTDPLLSACFDHPVRVRRHQGRWQLRIATA